MPETNSEDAMDGNSRETGRWGLLALVGAVSLCCLGTVALAGGAAVAGGTAAGVVAASGTVSGLREFVMTGVVTALPLLVIGLVLRRRTTNE